MLCWRSCDAKKDLIFVILYTVVVGSGTSNNEQGTSANQLLPVSSTTSSNVPVTSGEATSSRY